jgi:hypothetical protein
MTTYITDKATGRHYGVVASCDGGGLLLIDAENPTHPPVSIRWTEIFTETRFAEVASTSDLN